VSSTMPGTFARGRGSTMPSSRRSKGTKAGAKRGVMAGRGGGGGGGVDSASTTMIRSSNDNLIVAGSDLGPAIFFIFQKSILVSAGNSRY
jgi:hypothetical protein